MIDAAFDISPEWLGLKLYNGLISPQAYTYHLTGSLLVQLSSLGSMKLSCCLLLIAFSSQSCVKALMDTSEIITLLSTRPNYSNLTWNSGALLLRNRTEDPLREVTFCWRFFQFRTLNSMLISAGDGKGTLFQFYVVASVSDFTHFYRYFFFKIISLAPLSNPINGAASMWDGILQLSTKS